MNLSISNANTTMDSTTNSTLLSVVRDEDDSWIVTHHGCRVWGHGRTLLEAMCDFWAALGSHIGVMEDQPLVPLLERELRIMRWLREAQNQERPPVENDPASIPTETDADYTAYVKRGGDA